MKTQDIEKIKSETLFVIDPKTFRGTVVTTMIDGLVNYQPKPTTLDEYKKKKGNDRLIALPWSEFWEKYLQPYLIDRQKPFKEITQKEYEDALSELPPKRLTQFKGGEFFFCSEGTVSTLHACYVRKGDAYFTALREIMTPAGEIMALRNVKK